MYTCPYEFIAVDVNIAMTPEDWDLVTFEYRKVDPVTGDIINEAYLAGCEPDSFEPEYTVCTYTLRHYSDPSVVGVTDNWQRHGGVRSAPDSYGMRWYYSNYYYV